MKEISVPDGLEEYRLNDRVTVRFNPTDPVFLEKLSSAFAQLDALQRENAEKREKVTDEGKVFSLARDLDGRMREILNALFGQDVCAPLFGGLNVFASAGGLPLWANLMLAVAAEVQSAMQGELAAREERIARYVSKYQKSAQSPM